MKEAIRGELDACEGANGVFIPFAVESGSRCWGFASDDSDYDVRFVYVRPRDDYLRLDNVRDTIEWRLDDDLDVVGWDMVKFLRLLRASNPTAFEWLGSTITYQEEGCMKWVREVAPECFSPVAHANNYLGIATKHDVRYLRSGKATLKRYLYAIRALLACRYVIEEQRPAPMAFEELKTAKLEGDMVPLVDEVVQRKLLGTEKERCEAIPRLDEWVFRQEAELEEKIGLLKAPTELDWRVLNDLFLRILASFDF